MCIGLKNLIGNVGAYCLNARRIWASTPQIADYADYADERGTDEINQIRSVFCKKRGFRPTHRSKPS